MLDIFLTLLATFCFLMCGILAAMFAAYTFYHLMKLVFKGLNL